MRMVLTNYRVGHDAEEIAADYLAAHGYGIRQLNWKTQLCEIDIVAEKSQVIYFVEVKYRKNSNHGDGFDYITPQKLSQMQFAARCWIQENHWLGNYELSGIELSADYTVSEFLPTLT